MSGLRQYHPWVRELILANFTSGRYGYRLDPKKAADDVLDFLAPKVDQMLADERERIAREIASSVRYGFELRPDGSEDPQRAAYIEGLKDAHDIARGQA